MAASVSATTSAARLSARQATAAAASRRGNMMAPGRSMMTPTASFTSSLFGSDAAMAALTHTARGARGPLRGNMSAKASVETEEIDPMTGQVVEKIEGITNGFDLEVNNLKWHFKMAGPDDSDKPTILFLHGILSSSYSYRTMLKLASQAGYKVVAPDWIGFGRSEKPAAGKFDYSAESYVEELGKFVEAAGLGENIVVVTQGYVLGQYGMLFAARNKSLVDKLVVFNTPLGRSAKLPPALAAYKNPLMKRFATKTVKADEYAAASSSYVVQYDDAMQYQAPYESEDAAAAVDAMNTIMEGLDFKALVADVDQSFLTWRKDSLVAVGTKDRFLDMKQTYDWLEDKRTCMKMHTFEEQVGHSVQEDYPDVAWGKMVEMLL